MGASTAVGSVANDRMAVLRKMSVDLPLRHECDRGSI